MSDIRPTVAVQSANPMVADEISTLGTEPLRHSTTAGLITTPSIMEKYAVIGFAGLLGLCLLSRGSSEVAERADVGGTFELPASEHFQPAVCLATANGTAPVTQLLTSWPQGAIRGTAAIVGDTPVDPNHRGRAGAWPSFAAGVVLAVAAMFVRRRQQEASATKDRLAGLPSFQPTDSTVAIASPEEPDSSLDGSEGRLTASSHEAQGEEEPTPPAPPIPEFGGERSPRPYSSVHSMGHAWASEGPPTGSQVKPEYCILLAGKSGAGKTTLINSLANLIVGKSYEDDRDIAITQSFAITDPVTGKSKSLTLENNLPQFAELQTDRGGEQSQSQTTGCNQYRFETADAIVTFVDTPGLGDTQGTEQDQRNVSEIVRGVVKSNYVHAIALVHKASDCKSDAFLKYYIHEIKGLLPVECRDNLIVCFTGVVTLSKIDAIASLRALDLPVNRYVAFENDCLLPMGWVGEDSHDIAAAFWRKNAKSCQKLLDMVRQMVPAETQRFIDLHLTRQVFVEIVHEEARKVDQLNDKKALSQRLANDLAQKLATMSDNQDYVYEVDEEHVDVVQKEMTRTVVENIAPAKVTQCFVCNNICHNPCHLDELFARGHCSIRNCTAFGGKGDTCQQCQHGYQVHGHMQSITKEVKYTENIRTPRYTRVKKTDTAKEKRYTAAKDATADVQKRLEAARIEIRDLDDELDLSLRYIAFLYCRLREQSMQPINEYYLEYLDFREQQLKRETRITQSEFRTRLGAIRQKRNEYRLVKDKIDRTKKNAPCLTRRQLEALQQRCETKMKESAFAADIRIFKPAHPDGQYVLVTPRAFEQRANARLNQDIFSSVAKGIGSFFSG